MDYRRISCNLFMLLACSSEFSGMAAAQELGAEDAEVKTFAGGREVVVSSREWGGSFPVLVMYPTSTPSKTVEIGQYAVEVAWNAPIDGGRHRIVVVSHGTGGTHLGYRELASHLARDGFVVLMPEHPGNNRNNNELADTRENLQNRPRHISLAVDTIVHDVNFSRFVDPSRFAIIGHSMGGYTALALAGGNPSAAPGEPVDVANDERVAALVLMAPATPWFQGNGALNGVRVPILMLTGEKDVETPAWHADIVLRGVPSKTVVVHKIIENAGHFSFMSPFPDSMQDPQFAPSLDPEGFDRNAFQLELKGDVQRFLRDTLGR